MGVYKYIFGMFSFNTGKIVMKFSKQLFLIFCAATAIPFVILWFTLSEIMYEKEVADVKTQHFLIARNLGAALERYHTDLSAGFELVARNLVAGNKIVGTDQMITDLKFRHFCVADLTTGVVIAQAAPKLVPCPKAVPPKKLVFFKSLAKSEKPVFSPVKKGPNNISLIYILQTFGNKLVIGAVSTDYFISLGKAVSFGRKGHAAIIDQQGNLLAHPKPDWVAARKNIAKVSIVKSMLAGKSGVETFYSPALKADMIAGFTHVKGTGWSVMIPQPISELRMAARSAHKTIFAIVAVCILLAGLVALLVARKVMRPLKAVIEAAQAVEKGDRDVEVNIDESWHVPQEFTDMQQRFNSMAKAVATYQNEQEDKRISSENASRTKAEYFANLAHELKTPLNSILGFSSVLRQASPGTLKPHETSEFLGHIEKSAGHLLSFVNDLLDLNRLDMGAHQLNEQEFYLIDPIRFCETTLRKQIETKHINLSVECEDKSIKIFADERSINQILINLVGNAVRYSFDRGEVKIIAGIQGNGDLKILIEDHGIGIPEDDLVEIMQPFKRGSDPHMAEIHGTGLGLSIVNKLAHLHDIEFSIESEHGFSTTATLIIPKDRLVMKDKKTEAA